MKQNGLPSGERMYDDTMDDLSRIADICGL